MNMGYSKTSESRLHMKTDRALAAATAPGSGSGPVESAAVGGETAQTTDRQERKRQRRLEMVLYADRAGISEAARKYGTTRKTVRLWLNRYRRNGQDGLANRGRKEHRSDIAPPAPKTVSRRLVVRRRRQEPISPDRQTELIDRRQLELYHRRRSTFSGPAIRGHEPITPEPAAPRINGNLKNSLALGVLKLDQLPVIGSHIRTHGLPTRQLSLVDLDSGGAWIGYAYSCRPDDLDKSVSYTHLTLPTN